MPRYLMASSCLMSKLLGITRATLRKRIEKFGIKQELAIK